MRTLVSLSDLTETFDLSKTNFDRIDHDVYPNLFILSTKSLSLYNFVFYYQEAALTLYCF